MEKDEQDEGQPLSNLIARRPASDALDRKVSRAIETHNRVDKQALYRLLYPERQAITDEISTPSK